MSSAVADKPAKTAKDAKEAKAQQSVPDVPAGTILNLASFMDVLVAQELWDASSRDTYRANIHRTFLYDATDKQAYLVSTDTHRLFRAPFDVAFPGPLTVWEWLARPKAGLMLAQRTALDFPEWRRVLPRETRPVGVYRCVDGAPSLQIVGDTNVQTDLLPSLRVYWTVHRCENYVHSMQVTPYHQPYVFRSEIGEMILMPITPADEVLKLMQARDGK